ncbi:MAG: iron-containing alcohol dehydrogenase [Clostridiales bacterium]|nr:iron-containing alcohol dehydrogenase [Clostridiales bacterium]
MKFTLYMPTKVFYGKNCVKEQAKEFSAFGNKALIVTGKSSGKKSGALKDVTDILISLSIEYWVFDKVENNPSLETVKKGSIIAKANQVSVIIAIGGGSPIDAAKAIAALSVNNIEPIELLTTSIKIPSLPIIVIPTTAGTGSEVTPYSILTAKQFNTKKNFYSPYSFPTITFLDYKYTCSLPDRVTIDTAFDAFSHLLESYLSNKCTKQSAIYAIEGLKVFANCLLAIDERKFTDNIRDQLLYASYMGGLAITLTGTTIIHAMGYSLTYYKALSHGHANTLFIGEYLRFNNQADKEKIENVLKILKFSAIIDLETYLLKNIGKKPTISQEEINKFATLAMTQGSVKNNPRVIKESDIIKIYQKVLLR